MTDTYDSTKFEYFSTTSYGFSSLSQDSESDKKKSSIPYDPIENAPIAHDIQTTTIAIHTTSSIKVPETTKFTFIPLETTGKSFNYLKPVTSSNANVNKEITTKFTFAPIETNLSNKFTTSTPLTFSPIDSKSTQITQAINFANKSSPEFVNENFETTTVQYLSSMSVSTINQGSLTSMNSGEKIATVKSEDSSALSGITEPMTSIYVEKVLTTPILENFSSTSTVGYTVDSLENKNDGKLTENSTQSGEGSENVGSSNINSPNDRNLEAASSSSSSKENNSELSNESSVYSSNEKENKGKNNSIFGSSKENATESNDERSVNLSNEKVNIGKNSSTFEPIATMNSSHNPETSFDKEYLNDRHEKEVKYDITDNVILNPNINNSTNNSNADDVNLNENNERNSNKTEQMKINQDESNSGDLLLRIAVLMFSSTK